MEDYGEEVRTPPVTLVSIVGGDQNLQTTILTHLHSQQPPINTLALPDFPTVCQLLLSKSQKSNNKDDEEDHTQLPSDFSKTGIIKRNWILKHRTKVPAVVACLFDVANLLLANNPNHPFTHLDNLKSVIRGRNIKLVVVVVVPFHSKDTITEDRLLALRKRAELDAKSVITFIPDNVFELNQSLNRLGGIFAELAVTFYRDEGRRVKIATREKELRRHRV